MYKKKLSVRPFYTTQLKNLILLVALVTFGLKEFGNIQMPRQPLYPNESDLEVLRQRFLLWKFFSSPCYPLFNKRSSFLYLSCFRNIQRVKTTLAPEDEYCFLLLLLQATVIIMGIALINAKAMSVIVFAIILFSWAIEGDS